MAGPGLAARLRGLPTVSAAGLELPVATGARARLLGLAFLEREEVGPGLLIPRCRSVHTFGMRFGLDLVFLDNRGRVSSFRAAVPPRRFAGDRRADAVLELPSEPRDLRPSCRREGGEFLSLRP